ncbi:helix-turn-helix transcriptional regulator [Pokkaliibacter sp. MBI-7]|uniref:ArsR/SmtB family transcription factor n=1 Tax=Pokkaliibacter sp. MBI-7 TaxID=3040600 RepID=UPI00244D646D|nr:helix-turn-helix transcriptional regulator [Pokkaliibacter sp. MBI-7]MDH2434680.1 helix-turn-helix transcriptional regulator [Pokkaliibacter sp. MBI-7]
MVDALNQDTFQIARMATLFAEPSRAIMLMTLMDGRAYTAGELARVASLTPQTASGHLGMLTENGLLELLKQGRHRYYRLANGEVAEAIEALSRLTMTPRVKAVRSTVPLALRQARTCYDHIAGELGVAIYDGFFQAGFLQEERGSLLLTEAGRKYCMTLGMVMDEALSGYRQPEARPCLDWSERRYHLAGPLARALLEAYLDKDVLRRSDGSRQLRITPKGWQHFASHGIGLQARAG